MTKEQLEELYQGIINADKFQEKLILLQDEYHKNNDLNAYEVIKKVISTCKNKILNDMDEEAFYILFCCIDTSSDLDSEILDFLKEYYENQGKACNITSSYGISAITIYMITKDFDWYKKYLRIYCKIQTLNNDTKSVIRKFKKLNDNEFVEVINILIDGLNENRKEECKKVIEQLLSDDYKVRLIFDMLSNKGVNLYNYLELYCGYCSYDYEYHLIEYLFKNENEDISKVLSEYYWRDSYKEYSSLLFLDTFGKYINGKLDFSKFIKELFTNYKKFKESNIYNKILNLKIKNLNKLINRIEELRGYSNTEILLDESKMPELTYLLNKEIDSIYKKIAEMTSYEICIEELKNIKIKYSYEPKKELHKGIDIEEVIKQARIVRDMISNICPSCDNDNCCFKNDLFKISLDIFLEDSTYDDAKKILEVFKECQCQCKNKELRKEILKLKRLIMSLPYTSTIGGEYYNDSKTIILYLKNIYNDNPDNCGKKLLKTFAHELFHAYHAICVEESKSEWSYVKPDEKIVIESLASFFENEFSYESELVDSWIKSTIDVWPYAGAKHLTPYDKERYSINYPDNSLFKFVFMESLKSLSKAVKMIRFGEKMEYEEF